VKVESGRKWTFESTVKVDYAKYGMTVGGLQKNREVVICGLVCCAWPSWGLAAQSIGWCLSVVITKENRWTPFIKKQFPEALVVWYNSDELGGASWSSVRVWFSDVDLPRKIGIDGLRPRPTIVNRRRIQWSLGKLPIPALRLESFQLWGSVQWSVGMSHLSATESDQGSSGE
jgi:hypothetical protein